MSPVLYLVGTAAGPTQYIDDGVCEAQKAGWDVHLVLSPTAAGWWEGRLRELDELTGHQVRWRYSRPGRPKPPWRKADAMLVVPLTTTSLCRWAAGITDTLASRLPAEAVRLGVPVSVMPFWSTALGAQPAVARAMATLREQGVRVLLGGPDGYEPHAPEKGNAATYPWERALAGFP